MPIFRKKPVEVEAVQWNGELLVGGAPDWLAAVGEDLDQAPATVEAGRVAFHGEHLFIGTLEGTMVASPGDWIIRGTAGEIYPCKPEIFANIYEPVEPGAEPELIEAEEPLEIGRTTLSPGGTDA